MSASGPVGTAFKIRYEFPEDGPRTLLVLAPPEEWSVRWVKSARVRLPGSDRWVNLDLPPERDLTADPIIIGLRTFSLEDEAAFRDLKEEAARRGTERLVIELEEVGGRKRVLEMVSSAVFDRMEEKAKRRNAKGGKRSGSAAKVLKFG